MYVATFVPKILALTYSINAVLIHSDYCEIYNLFPDCTKYLWIYVILKLKPAGIRFHSSLENVLVLMNSYCDAFIRCVFHKQTTHVLSPHKKSTLSYTLSSRTSKKHALMETSDYSVSELGHLMTWSLFDVRSLPGPMPACCELDSIKTITALIPYNMSRF